MRIKNYIFAAIVFFLSYTNLVAQNFVPFTPRFDRDLRGDMLIIGNNILNRDTNSTNPNDPYNGGGQNGWFTMGYIDIDSDATTFSSSSADLDIPDPSASSCYRIVHAGLYWSGMIQSGSRTDLDKVKLRLPGAAAYTNITGSLIYDADLTPINGGKPYACYADVTSLVTALANPEGTYTLANVLSSTGTNGGLGLSAGWSIFIVYEDPTLTAKSIVSFDGFSGIDGSTNLNIPVSGFRTIPVGPVRAKFAFTALEGDQDITGDFLRINGTTISTPQRPNNNFFNSSITTTAGFFTTRTPNGSNTLGYDAGVLNVNNPGNAVIANNATTATIRLGTGGDVYYYFFNALAVEIIEPEIILTKVVKDLAGNLIGGADVNLCQDLIYEISFQNIGNDDTQNFTIRDILPINVTFNPLTAVLPPGVTITYPTATPREIIFNIPNNLVNIGDPIQTIRIPVRVVCSCTELDDACSNVVTNQAFATYQGVINTTQITDDPSLSGFSLCNLSPPSPTNFLVGLDDCNFTTDVVMCGGNPVTLTAANGYTSYVWSGPGTITPVAGTNNQSVIITTPGVYTVNDIISLTPCRSIVQTFNVVDFTAGLTNPVIPYADQVVICPNDGVELPLIFLCGLADSQLIQTNISGATSIIWEQLNTASCAAVVNPNCANINPLCTWTNVGSGPNYNATSAGQFRITIVFPNGCSRTFYFNVFQNLLNPIAVPRDAVCTTPGSITITGVPAGYEYQLNCTGSYVPGNIFTGLPAGTYSVCIRQIGITGGCVFTLTNIPIRNRNFTVSATITQPLCFGEKGTINLAANDVLPQYTFTIFQQPGNILVSSFGPTNNSNNVFTNLNPGTYSYTVTTQDGCTFSAPFTINNPPLLTVTAAITMPIACADGEITIYPVGGTPPYNFVITGAMTSTQASPIIVAPAPGGTYNIQVVDFNNCTANTSITIAVSPPPVFTVSQTNVLCYGSNTGAINFNVTNANGFTLEYSIDGVNFFPTPNFPNLVAGTYTIIVRYTLGTAVCLTTPATIIITQPFAALTASAGVSELAGCGPLGEGMVRIINPQGGVPPYSYSFNNCVTYGPLNQAYLMPGTYTVCIRDSNMCVFPMTVTLDPAPSAPTITVTPPVFACNGSATSTVTVNSNGGSFLYTYSLDAVPNTPPSNNVFTNVPCGPHTVTVNYQATNIPTFSNLLFEDFGIGANTTTPGIAAAYCFNPQAYPPGQPCGNFVAGFPASACGTWFVNDNQYVVTSALNPNNCAWFNFRDHTSLGTNPNGRFLAVNIGSAAGPNGILYSKQINSVIPNQPVIVEAYLANLLRSNLVGGSDPSFSFELVDGAGVVVASQTSTDILRSDTWQLRSFTLNPGPNTSLTFNVRSGSIIYGGNDALIDDINVYQIPVACITTRNFPINIACNQAFTAQVTGSNNVSCNGGNNGTITIAAQNFAATGFQYSTNGGTTWTNSLVSPVTITGLIAATYNILIRYDSNPANTACSFPFTTVITQPAVLVASATLTPATCLTGGVITASATGGTTAYQYQLQTSPGAVIVAPYQASGTFTNVATGSYVVLVRDANLCTSTSVIINVVAPTLPTLVLSAAPPSDFCYDAVNGSTLIVTASGGLAPYSFSIGGPYQASNTPVNSHTFSNLVPGTYTISVLDANGCTNTVPFTQTINPQLTLSTVLTKDLDCTASPNAVITGTIAGGYPGYTCLVNVNGGGFVTNVPVVGSTFTYSTPTPGTYQFQVTDTRGCIVQSTVITINVLSLPDIISVTQTTPILCNGDNTAAINVLVNNAVGTAPFVINVQQTTAPFTNYGTQTTGLPAGSYTITLTDAKSCTDTATIVIAQPAVIAYTTTINPITCGGAGGNILGSICINAPTGGTPPYIYTLIDQNTGGSTTFGPTASVTHCFPNINFGLYTTEVTDANNCTIVKPNLVMSSPPSDLTFVITPTIPSCAAGATVTVSVVPIVAGGPYEFGIVDLPIAPFASVFSPPSNPPLTHIFSGLTPGAVYTFVVRDVITGCLYFETMTAPTPTNSTLVPVLTPRNVTCRGAANGTISATLTGHGAGATSINYVVNNATTGLPVISGTIAGPPLFNLVNAGPLPPGNYVVYFSEVGGANAGCGVTSAPFVISESSTPLTLTASVIKNDNCNLNAGQIVAVASGGTAPYLYQILPFAAVPPIASSPGWSATNNVLNAESGSYVAYVIDANGCIVATAIIVLPLDPSPVIAATLVNACVAQGTYQINVTMPTVGIAPYTFSIDGGAFVANTAPFTISGLSSGTHTIAVRDRNGCGNSVSVTILNPLIVSAVFTTQPTCFNNNGTITATASGGSAAANYTYTLLNSLAVVLAGPQASNVFLGRPAGCYIIRVTDSATGCSANTPFCLTLPTPVTFTAVPTSVTCSGGTNGTITINLTGLSDNPPYTYQIIAPLAFATAPQSSNVFTGLPAGTYTVQVNSGRGCQLIDNNVIVGTPNPIAVPAATITQFGCAAGTNAANLATITVTGVTGGSGVYTNYQFMLGATVLQSGPSNTYSTANAAGGTYTINVFDNNGCLGTTTAIINPYIAISNPTVTVNSPITCTTNEQITIAVTVTGGVPPVFTYTVTGLNGNPYNVTQNTPTFTGLTIGDYQITVLNSVTGCSVQTIHYVFDPNTFDLLINSIVDVTCLGGNDGSANITIIDNDVTPVNEAGPFNYTILDSLGAPVTSGSSATAGPVTVSGLPSGIYTANVTLIAAPFCTTTQNFTISQPTSALAIAATSSPITCVTGNNDGTITASATGGWGAPYQFQLQIGAAVITAYNSNPNFTGLTQATYTVYVRDVRGCIVTTNVVLANPTPINAVVTPSAPTVTCFGDCNATLSISYPTGGQGSNYSYILHQLNPTVSQSGPIAIPLGGVLLTGLCADTYRVEIFDGFSCRYDSGNIVIAQPNIVNANLTQASILTCTPGSASVTLTGSGGTPPYSYSPTGIAGSFIGSFNPSITIGGLNAGTYHYYVQDALGCLSEVSGDVVINPITPLSLSTLASANILCGGSATGTITAVANGGLLGYVYTLLDAALNPIPGATQLTPGNFSNLPAGTYFVNVTSLDCTFTSPSVIITEPIVFDVIPTPIPVRCNGGNDGAVNLVITGGTGTIQYAISPRLDQFFVITNPYVAGGFNIPGLTSGNYTIIVQDQNGCNFTFNNINVSQPSAVISNITSFVNEECAEQDLGEIVVGSIGGGIAPYTITYTVVYPGTTTVVTSPIIPLAAGVTTYNFTGLNGGNYTTIVTDANGCKSESQQIIGSGVSYQPQATPTFPCVNNQPAVRVEVINLFNPPSNTFNPLSNYLFSLDVNSVVGAQASNIFTSATYPSLLTPGPHTIYVFHANGCDKASNSFTINATDIDPLNLNVAEVFLNQIVATITPVTGGTAPYVYTFEDETGSVVQNGANNIYIYDHSAEYTVTVTDNSGCTDSALIPVTFIPIVIPPAYTPGDGSGWSPQNTSNYPNLITYIYDRYGRKVAELPEGQQWYGKYEGKELPSGDYWYVVKVDASNAEEFVGHFTLYR